MPVTKHLVSWGIFGRLDGVMLNNEWIELDHGDMIMQLSDDMLPAERRRKWGDVGIHCPLSHGRRWEKHRRGGQTIRKQ